MKSSRQALDRATELSRASAALAVIGASLATLGGLVLTLGSGSPIPVTLPIPRWCGIALIAVAAVTLLGSAISAASDIALIRASQLLDRLESRQSGEAAAR